MKKNNKQFSFEISLSVLNHLGRNLYRSFVTVLGEAISNSWDADAQNVWIYIDRENDKFVIKDDGIGMTEDDFQEKFLRIGYSKRKDANKSAKNRPFIGRKGIGKLALLSCANKITVISKVKGGGYVGGVIDNSDLSEAITNDLTPTEYLLAPFNPDTFKQYIKGHGNGTIILFEGIKGGIKNSLSLLKKVIALYFRFSLIDTAFNIFIDDEKITHKHLSGLAEKTEFLWNINQFEDPYIENELTEVKKKKNIKMSVSIDGFVASVGKPRDLKIFTTDEKVSIDLFVNGRLREKDILKHISTARVVENYLYGQIHYNELDENAVDRFTSSREGVVADDPKYKKFLENIQKNLVGSILNDWDTWRRENREDGDSENESITRKDRKSGELFNAVSEDYTPPRDAKDKNKIDGWVDDLKDDAKYNFTSYAECFISENLIRKYIQDKKISLTSEATKEIGRLKTRENDSKGKGNISIDIRKNNSDLSYLSMDDLANLVDKKNPQKEACLARDANEYKPIRDALAHTALLTDKAKKKLSSVYENIKGRINLLLSGV